MKNSKYQILTFFTLIGLLLLVSPLGMTLNVEEIQPSISLSSQQAFQHLGLKDANEFTQGFKEGLSDMQSIDLDLKQAEPYLPFFMERSLSEKGIGSAQVGRLAAYHFLFNCKIRGYGKPILTKEEAQPTIGKLNQLRDRCETFLNTALPQTKEAEDLRAEIAYLIARDQRALYDPTYISAMENVDDTMTDKFYNGFVTAATELLNMDNAPSILKEKYPGEDLGDDNLPKVLQQMLRVRAVQNQFLKLYQKEFPRKPFFRSPAVMQFIRSQNGQQLRKKINDHEKIFTELYQYPSVQRNNEHARIKGLFREKMLNMNK